MTDIAFPLKRARVKPDTLKWVLRTVEYHMPVDRVFIASPLLPKWINPEAVVWLPTLGQGKKHENISENLNAVIESDIEEDFVWFNDDFFVVKDTPEVELHHRAESYDQWYEDNKDKSRGGNDHWSFIGGMLGQWEFLKEHDLPTDLCTDLHVPMPVNKTRLKQVVNALPVELTGHFRAIYGAGLVSTPMVDPKWKEIEGHHPDDWRYLSVHPGSWKDGAVGRWVRDRYFRPSRFEI